MGTLFEYAQARASDPETSREAAQSISPERITATKERILAVLRIYKPLTHQEIIEVFRSAYPDFAVTDQSIRSRCKELERSGLIWFAGEYGETSSGRRSRKWAA